MAERFAKPMAYLARIMKLAVLVVVVVHAIEEVRHRGRRASRRAAGWWENVEHRERDELYEAELTALARWLSRTESPSRWLGSVDRRPPAGKG